MKSLRLRLLAWMLGAALCLFAGAAGAQVRVFACEPEWAALADEIGGERVSVHSATSARQDPHYIEARPSLIAKLRRSDLLVCSGADLEVGWLPLLLRRAANAQVQPGARGHLDVSKIVPMLGVTDRVDRSEGDVHPSGNPHTQTDPRNVALVARELASRLAAIEPAAAEHYRARAQAFSQRWGEAIARWETQGRELQGMRIVTHHAAWVYLARWLGLELVGQLEQKPGIPPTAGHLAALLEQLREEPPELIVRAAYQAARPSEWLSQRSGIPAVVLPQTVGATPDAGDLFAWFDAVLARLLEARRR